MPVVRANRKVKAGKHAILDVFPGLDKSVAFRAIFPDGLREEVLRDCRIDVVPEDMYMYIDDDKGNVVAGLGYLQTGEDRILYLDVLHELTHIRQWHAGKELWDRRYNYVDRPTEVEAYQVAVDEARRLDMSDREIADYLRVEWTSREEHERLCKHVGVPSRALSEQRPQMERVRSRAAGPWGRLRFRTSRRSRCTSGGSSTSRISRRPNPSYKLR